MTKTIQAPTNVAAYLFAMLRDGATLLDLQEECVWAFRDMGREQAERAGKALARVAAKNWTQETGRAVAEFRA
jgi:hypothetical protein